MGRVFIEAITKKPLVILIDVRGFRRQDCLCNSGFTGFRANLILRLARIGSTIERHSSWKNLNFLNRQRYTCAEEGIKN